MQLDSMDVLLGTSSPLLRTRMQQPTLLPRMCTRDSLHIHRQDTVCKHYTLCGSCVTAVPGIRIAVLNSDTYFWNAPLSLLSPGLPVYIGTSFVGMFTILGNPQAPPWILPNSTLAPVREFPLRIPNSALRYVHVCYFYRFNALLIDTDSGILFSAVLRCPRVLRRWRGVTHIMTRQLS